MNEKIRDLYLTAINLYGSSMQTDIAMEEMGELIQAIVKYRRKNTVQNLDNIAEEIADVQIMLDQLKIIYNCEHRVKEQMLTKQARLHERISNERFLQDG